MSAGNESRSPKLSGGGELGLEEHGVVGAEDLDETGAQQHALGGNVVNVGLGAREEGTARVGDSESGSHRFGRETVAAHARNECEGEFDDAVDVGRPEEDDAADRGAVGAATDEVRTERRGVALLIDDAEVLAHEFVFVGEEVSALPAVVSALLTGEHAACGLGGEGAERQLLGRVIHVPHSLMHG